MPIWYAIDSKVAAWLYSRFPPVLSQQVALVDIYDYDTQNYPRDRETVAKFLRAVLAHPQQRPDAVIVDIEFGPCEETPCSAVWNRARSELISSLNAVANSGIGIFMAEGIRTDQTDAAVDRVTAMDELDPLIYAHIDEVRPKKHEVEIFDHFRDVAQTHIFSLADPSVLAYRRCYTIPLQGGYATFLWSVTSRVQIDSSTAENYCDSSHTILRYGPAFAPLDQSGHAVTSPPEGYSVTSMHPFPTGANFDSRYIILGTVASDRALENPTGESSPELLAWALSDDLESGESGANLYRYYVTHPDNDALLIWIPAFSALTVVLFTACFFLLRRMRLGGMRSYLSLIAAIAAVLISLGAFALYESFDLLSQRTIQPQVTLICIGILLSAALCGVRGKQIEFEQLWNIDLPRPEKYDYDVFISYAHEETKWVYDNIYTPLRDAQLPDGRRLAIFFDTEAIRYAAAWQKKITLSLQGSRIVVPVFSDTYFTKPYCVFEIYRAHRKWIGEGQDSRCVLPVTRGHPVIPEAINDFQAPSIDDKPDLIQEIVAEIVARLSSLGHPAEPSGKELP